MLNEFRSTYITWDKATRRIYSPITANESDSNGRKLNIQVVNSGQVENLTGATLHLYWETKDKSQHGLDPFDASDISKGEFEIFYTTGMLSNVGELNATLVLVDTTGKVVSDWFKITVTRGINESAIESENSFTTLTQALIDISNLEQNYAPRLNDLTAQLQQKVGGGKLASMADMGQDVKESMTGGSVAVVGEGAVAWNNLANDIKIDYPINMFNKDAVSIDTLFNATTGEPITYSGYALSDFIPVEVGKTYTITNGNSSNLIAVYDDTGYLGKLNGATGTNAPYTFTVTNAQATRIRININLGFDDLSKYLMVEGSTLPDIYTEYNQKRYEMRNVLVNAANLYNVNKKWANKKVYLFGDSITYWDQRPYWNDESYHIVGYPTYIRDELGATTINKAVGGATISTVKPNNINKQVKSITFNDADACIITGGTNDVANGTVLGTLGNREDTIFDNTTYYGSLREMIHYIYTNNPNTKIYLLAPLPMLESTTSHFADAMREVGKMYGIPVLSMDWDVQINRQNMDIMMFDGVHPNNEGHKLMADAIVPFLQNH